MKIKLKIEFNHCSVYEHLTVDDLDTATRYALDVTRRLVDGGRKYVAVSLFVNDDSVAYVVFKKKDVVDLRHDKTTLTKKELEILKILIDFYNKSHYENADFFNVFDSKTCVRASSVVASLVKKGVLTMSTCPGCFNPLYPGVNFMSVVKDYDIDVDDKTREYWNFVYDRKEEKICKV